MAKKTRRPDSGSGGESAWPSSVTEKVDARGRVFEKIVEDGKRALRQGTAGDDPASKATLILGACAARVWSRPTTHLRRVTMTLGVLQAVRSGLRYINGERDGFRPGLGSRSPTERTPILWTGQTETLKLIDESSSEVAGVTFSLVHEALEGRTLECADAIGQQVVDFPILRPDLRFAEQPGSEPVPFGPEFPEFEPRDIPVKLISQMKRDIAEMSSLNLPKLRDKDAKAKAMSQKDRDLAARNMVDILVTIVALGKCVMCQWPLEHGRFLDFLACLSEDHELSEPS